MKRLLIAILFCTSAFAADSDWNIRVKYGTAGALPFADTDTQLPKPIVNAVAFAAKDPAVQIVSWPRPIIFQVNANTKAWKFTVTTQYRNYTVFAQKDRVDAY